MTDLVERATSAPAHRTAEKKATAPLLLVRVVVVATALLAWRAPAFRRYRAPA